MGFDEITLRNNADVLVKECGRVKNNERILVIADNTTAEVARYILEAARTVISTACYELRIFMTFCMQPTFLAL